MSQINLAFLCNSPKVPAGVEKTTIMLLDRIDRERFSVRFILNGRGPFYDQLMEHEADVEVIETTHRYSRKWHQSLKSSLVTRPADVVQLHLSRLNGPAIRSIGVRTVERLNMTRHGSFRYPMQWRWLDACTSKWIDHFIVVSESLKRQFMNRGYPSGKLTVVYNGIDTSTHIQPCDLRSDLGLPTDSRLIGFAGRLTSQKGIDLLLDVVPGILRQISNCHVIIAGDGELRSTLENHASQLKIKKNVHFLGFRKDILNVIAGFDVMAYLSRWEPFANTILEAMSLGVPVVASDAGGNAEALVHRRNGLLVPATNRDTVANAIIALLTQPELRRRLTDNANIDVQKFSIAAMVDAHEQVYEALTVGSLPRRNFDSPRQQDE